MKTKKTLMTLAVLMAGLFQTSFTMQGTLSLAEVEADKARYRKLHEPQNYRSLAAIFEENNTNIVQTVNNRITQVNVIHQVIQQDKELLEKLVQQSADIKLLIQQHKNDHSKINELRKKTKELKAQITLIRSKLTQNIQKLEEENSGLNEELDSVKTKNAELSQELMDSRQQFDEALASAQGDIEASNDIIDQLGLDLEGLRSELALKEEEFKKLEAENCAKEQKISKLEEEISQTLKDKEEIMTALAELEEELENIQNEEEENDDSSDDSSSTADSSNITVSDAELETLVAAFGGILNSQMELIQQMQAQNQQFMMTQSLQGMGPVDTSAHTFGYGHYGYPGIGIGGGYTLPYLTMPTIYHDFVTGPQYSLIERPQVVPHFYQGGIPSHLSFGGGRSPAITQSPIIEGPNVMRAPSQAPIFNQVPQHYVR